MSDKKLKIKLLPNGEIHMETVDVKGKKCLDYIDVLKKLVDAKDSDEFDYFQGLHHKLV